jgi:hypothetical protein
MGPSLVRGQALSAIGSARIFVIRRQQNTKTSTYLTRHCASVRLGASVHLALRSAAIFFQFLAPSLVMISFRLTSSSSDHPMTFFSRPLRGLPSPSLDIIRCGLRPVRLPSSYQDLTHQDLTNGPVRYSGAAISCAPRHRPVAPPPPARGGKRLAALINARRLRGSCLYRRGAISCKRRPVPPQLSPMQARCLVGCSFFRICT